MIVLGATLLALLALPAWFVMSFHPRLLGITLAVVILVAGGLRCCPYLIVADGGS